MKLKIRGVNTGNLSVPLEDMEGAIPVLAEMIHYLREDLHDATTSLLEVGDTAQIEIFKEINTMETAFSDMRVNTSKRINDTETNLRETINNVQREVQEEIDNLREEIFGLINNTWYRRLWKFLNRDIKLGRI